MSASMQPGSEAQRAWLTHTTPIRAWVEGGSAASGAAFECAQSAALSLAVLAQSTLKELLELCDALEASLARMPRALPAQLFLARDVLGSAVAYLERMARVGEGARVVELKASAEERGALLAALRAASAAIKGPQKAPEPIAAASPVSGDAPPEPAPERAAADLPRSAPPAGEAARETLASAALLELFRVECEEHSARLSDGLVALEAIEPNDHLERDGRLRELMRAAHSLKGAARVAGLAALSSLAHNLEDRLILWSESGSFDASEADLLLGCVDLFRDAAKLPVDQADVHATVMARAAKLEQKLDEPRGTLPSRPSLPRIAPRVSQRPQLASTPPAQASPVIEVVSDSPSIVPAAPSLPPMKISAAPRALERSEKRVLRVATENLDRLTGLAGESLVESRRVSGLAETAVRVRKRQRRLSDLLLACEDAGRNRLDDRTRELLQAAIAESSACGALLTEHAESLDRHVQRTESLGERLYRESLQSRMRPFVEGARGFPRVVRDIARKLGKKVRFELEGQDTKVDREILEGLDAPLGHLLRNAIDHGIETPAERLVYGKAETAVIRMRAHHNAGALVIVVSDDGRGIDLDAVRARVIDRKLASAEIAATLNASELCDFLFLPAFSTARHVSEISGRGVGLDVVKSTVESLGGSVRVESQAGFGAAFHLSLPVTRSVVRAVSARVGAEMFAFPLHRIDRIDRIEKSALRAVEGTPCFLFDGDPVSLVTASSLLGHGGASATPDSIPVVMVSDRGMRFAIAVDELCGEHDLVVRPLDPRLGKVQDIAAATLLEDGTPALIVDIDDLLRSVERASARTVLSSDAPSPSAQALAARKRVLVVDDSITVREAERQLLVQHGYSVDIAVDGIDGLNAMRRKTYDLVITDIDMPRLNGFELIRAIRKDQKLAPVPVVIVSYKDRDEDRKLGLEVGASYYLTKASFHDERLLEAVQDLIGEAL